MGGEATSSWWDSRSLAWMLLLATALGVWIPFWPGIINPDSFGTITQADAGVYTNWWTPFGAWLLHLWQTLGLGLGGVYAIAVVVCVCGAYMCVRFALRRIPAALTTLVICWIPPDYAQLSGVSRDVFFLGFALLGFGLLGRAFQGRVGTRGSAVWLTVAAVAAEVVAYLSRQNGVSALVALIFGALLLLRGRAQTRLMAGRSGVALSFLLALVVSGAMAIVTIDLESATGVKNVYPQRVLYIYDLASISKLSGHDYFPERLVDHPIPGGTSPLYVHQGQLDRLFNPYNVVSLYIGNFAGTIQFGNMVIAKREDALLRPAWEHAVEHEPFDYAFGRVRVLAVELGLWDDQIADDYLALISPDNYGYPLLSKSRYRSISNILSHTVGPGAEWRFDILWIWLLIMVGCLTILIRRERARMAFMALAPIAVALNLALLLLVTMGGSYRYINLTIPATLTLIAYALASFAKDSPGWRPIVAPRFIDRAVPRPSPGDRGPVLRSRPDDSILAGSPSGAAAPGSRSGTT